MKHVVAAAALFSLAMLPALAESNYGSITGRVVDAQTGNAIAGAPVLIYRMPVHQGDAPVDKMRTNGRGEFADVALPMGRYLVATRVGRLAEGCNVDDVYQGFSTRMKIAIGSNEATCSGPRVRTALVNPAITADVYVITGDQH